MGSNPKVAPGRYRHYKGGEYEVLGVGRAEETHEKLVIYRALYRSEEFGDNALWARPLSSFIESVTVNGKKVPRFVKVG